MTCRWPRCKNTIKARGLCPTHYHRERRRGRLDWWERTPGYPWQLASDETLGVPLICVCPTSIPERVGQCRTCYRRVAQLMAPHHYRAAEGAYPQIANQRIDWTHR
jgi:hypothetical protein